jgi:hypothetical protein
MNNTQNERPSSGSLDSESQTNITENTNQSNPVLPAAPLFASGDCLRGSWAGYGDFFDFAIWCNMDKWVVLRHSTDDTPKDTFSGTIQGFLELRKKMNLAYDHIMKSSECVQSPSN